MFFNRVKKIIIQNKGILLLLLIYTVLYSFNLDKFPAIIGDECWFCNPAYNLAISGKMGTTMIYGYNNIANFTYWQPPMFILLLATSFKLFGFGVVQARTVSVSLGFLTVLFTYLFAYKLYNKKIGLLASLLLISNPLFFLVSRQARMEIAVAFFMLIALYCTVMALKNSNMICYFASAFFATLAFLSHPNGLISIFAVLIIILANKIDLKTLNLNLNFKKIFIFILGVIIPLIPYTLYIFADFAAFQGQFMSNIGHSPLNPLKNIIMELTRYIQLYWLFVCFEGRFLTFVVFATTITLTILGLYYLVRERKFSDKFLLIVLMVNIGVLTVLVSHKWEIYLGFIVPYLSIIIALTFKDKMKFEINKKGMMSVIIIVFGILLIIGNFIAIYNVLLAGEDYYYQAIEHEIQNHIPQGSVVVGDRKFWMALQNDYKYYGSETMNTTGIADLNVEYILFTDFWASRDGTMVNFVTHNCTLIAEIPHCHTFGIGTVKVYKVNSHFS